MQTKLVIFDCDGVLVDSETISARTLIECLYDFGVSVSIEYVFENFVGRSFPTVKHSIETHFETQLPNDFRDQYWVRLKTAFTEELCETSGLTDVLTHLAPDSCVATSSSPSRVNHTLRTTGLEHWFAGRVFTACEVENGKPAPDLFLHVAASFGVTPEHCLVIEDSTPGLAAARAAKMPVIHYVGGSHLQIGPDLAGNDELQTLDTWDQFFDLFPTMRKREH